MVMWQVGDGEGEMGIVLTNVDSMVLHYMCWCLGFEGEVGGRVCTYTCTHRYVIMTAVFMCV